MKFMFHGKEGYEKCIQCGHESFWFQDEFTFRTGISLYTCNKCGKNHTIENETFIEFGEV